MLQNFNYHKMNRREFIKLTGAATVTSLLPFEVSAMLSTLNLKDCDFSNRKLVLINLNGGNDGLNTVVPINQYDIYSNLRPVIRVPETGIKKYITLDSKLPDNQQIGLHPSLKAFKELYDAGELRVIQSVGYPNQNKSHFSSRDLYNTGNDGNGFENGKGSGWIGRFMENMYVDELALGYPFAVQLGSVRNSLGFHGEQEHGMSLNITKQDTAGFYSVINGLAGVHPSNVPKNTDYGVEMDFILKTDKLSNVYAKSVSEAFNKGDNSVTYQNTDIDNQLKTVARLIRGGLSSKIYMVRLDGFDTHANQLQTGNGDILGKHNSLLSRLSKAVGLFMKDVNDLTTGEDVVAVTYSEFGRKAAENGSKGTDHGEAAPMFVIGKSIKGGVSGTNPDLTEPEKKNNWQIKTVQHDYRAIFGTLLKDYMGGDTSVIDATFFDHSNNKSFVDSSIPDLVKEKFKIDENCKTIVGTIEDEIENEQSGWFAAPNPFETHVELRNDHDVDVESIQLYDYKGKLVKIFNNPSNNGFIRLELANFQSGVYIAHIHHAEKNPDRITLIKR